jgi:aryl-phospho-beta-D-glucosidase BglC (GH1 family)
MKKTIFILLFLLGSFLRAQTPVEINGALSVKGNQIVNSKGVAVSFAGNSLFNSNARWKGKLFYNKHLVKWLQIDWNTTIIRCAMGADPKVEGGYLEDPIANEKSVQKVVKAAIDLGMYVIIDWHSHHAEDNEAEAIAFFKKMAKLYGKYPNIIYEIYNEPLNVSWDTVIKPYAEHVIAAIRKIDKNNLIIVGTPKWSQDVDIVSKNPITGFKNIAYTLHFYAGTHKEELREKAILAMDNGIAIMVTEWGTVNANGDGNVDAESVAKWMNFMKKYNLSHCNWAVNDKKEGASIVVPGSNPKGGWTEKDLTPSGKLTKGYIVNWDKKEDD